MTGLRAWFFRALSDDDRVVSDLLPMQSFPFCTCSKKNFFFRLAMILCISGVNNVSNQSNLAFGTVTCREGKGAFFWPCFCRHIAYYLCIVYVLTKSIPYKYCLPKSCPIYSYVKLLWEKMSNQSTLLLVLKNEKFH